MTTKTNSTVDVFSIGEDGRPSAVPVKNPGAPVPFAWVFDHAGRMVLSFAGNSSLETFRVNPDNTIATATSHVKAPTPTADLSVTKTGSPDPVQAGSNITYTIGVANAGPSDAQNVTLTDAIPANTTFVSFSQTAGPPFVLTAPRPGETGTVTATATSFANGASATFQLVVNVNLGTQDGTIISNTATVSSSTGDSNTANNSATVTTGVGGFGT